MRPPPARPIAALLPLAVLTAAACRSPAPPSPSDLRAGARTAAADGDLDEATALAERSLALEPRSAEGHQLCADLYLERGRRELAFVGYERALALDPTDPSVQYNLGTLYLEDGDPLRAARLLEEAVRLRPDHAPSFNNLGKAYFLLGLPELAGPAFEEALALEPGNEAARANLALLTEGAS